MTDARPWPRYLNREDAAAYLGVSTGTFDREVRSGMWPAPIRRGAAGRRVTWDRHAIDLRADNLSGMGAGRDQQGTDAWLDMIDAD